MTDGHIELGRKRMNVKARKKTRIVHVPVVHGIGERDAERWYCKAVLPLATRLVEHGRFEWQRVTDCEQAECGPHLRGRQHCHLISPELPAQIDLVAVSWVQPQPRGIRQKAVSWVRDIGWLTTTVLVLFLVLFAGNTLQFMRVLGEGRGRWLLLPYRGGFTALRWVGRTVMMLVLTPLVVIGCAGFGVASLFLPNVLRHVHDARMWTGSGSSRVLDSAASQLQAPKAAARVVIGHSQGGAIVTKWASMTRSSTNRTSLITVGSGDVLLLARAAIDSRGKMVWVWLMAVAAPVFALTVLGQLAPLSLVGLHYCEVQFTSFAYIRHALWLAGSDPYGAVAFMVRALSNSIQGSDSMRIALESLPSPTLGSTIPSAMVAALFVTAPGVVRDLAAKFGDARSKLPGMDLGGRHDYVSSTISVLKPNQRYRRIPVSGAFPLDHLDYFKAGPIVLEPIAQHIEQAAQGGPLPASRKDRTGQAAISEYSHRLHNLLWWVPLAAFLLAAVTTEESGLSALAPGFGSLAGLWLAFAAYILAAWPLSAWLRRRTNRMTQVRLADAWSKRFKSWPVGVAGLALAFPLTSASGPLGEAAAFGLAVGSVGILRGSTRTARVVAICAGLVGAIVWLARLTPISAIAAVAYALFSAAVYAIPRFWPKSPKPVNRR